MTCIIGGSKISTKIDVITSLIKKIDNLIIVGAMANNFLSFKGFNIGKSLIEKEMQKIIGKIYDNGKKEYNCDILIPEDCKVGTNLEEIGKIKRLENIENNEIILDIGNETIKKILQKIDNSNTVLWNGPAGYFEK